MRSEIARVSPSRQTLTTCGTNAAVEQQPAIRPKSVGSQACMDTQRARSRGRFRSLLPGKAVPFRAQGRRMRSAGDQSGHEVVVPGGGLALALEAGFQRGVGAREV